LQSRKSCLRSLRCITSFSLASAYHDNYSGAGADTVAISMRSALWRLSTNPAVLPYLKAVVRESLRMYPSVPAPLYRIVPAGGITVDGQLIPPGTVVGISSLAQNRDTAIFGQDPNVFNPDRWLGDEAEARYMEAALFNFGGSGPRSCPGRDLAMVSQRNLLRRHMLILHDRLSYTNLSLRLSRSSILRWWTRHIHSR
jgi:cytochrome P450